MQAPPGRCQLGLKQSLHSGTLAVQGAQHPGEHSCELSLEGKVGAMSGEFQGALRLHLDVRCGVGGEPGLGTLTWCGCEGFLGPCQNACTPLGPSEDLGTVRERGSGRNPAHGDPARSHSPGIWLTGRVWWGGPRPPRPGGVKAAGRPQPTAHKGRPRVAHQKVRRCRSPWGSPGPAGRK